MNLSSINDMDRSHRSIRNSFDRICHFTRFDLHVHMKVFIIIKRLILAGYSYYLLIAFSFIHTLYLNAILGFGVISSDHIERAFRRVDRKFFVPRVRQCIQASSLPLFLFEWTITSIRNMYCVL